MLQRRRADNKVKSMNARIMQLLSKTNTEIQPLTHLCGGMLYRFICDLFAICLRFICDLFSDLFAIYLSSDFSAIYLFQEFECVRLQKFWNSCLCNIGCSFLVSRPWPRQFVLLQSVFALFRVAIRHSACSYVVPPLFPRPWLSVFRVCNICCSCSYSPSVL